MESTMDRHPTQQEIAQRAYAMWEQEGKPHGRNLDHWLTAEKELTGSAPAASPRRTESAKRGSRPAAAGKAATKAKPRARSAKSTSKDLH
jgi:hypothetical protein